MKKNLHIKYSLEKIDLLPMVLLPALFCVLCSSSSHSITTCSCWSCKQNQKHHSQLLYQDSVTKFTNVMSLIILGPLRRSITFATKHISFHPQSQFTTPANEWSQWSVNLFTPRIQGIWENLQMLILQTQQHKHSTTTETIVHLFVLPRWIKVHATVNL